MIHKTAIVDSKAKVPSSTEIGPYCVIGPNVVIGENVKIGNNVKIYPNAYVGDNSKLGDNVIVFAGAKIYSETIIGNNCVIHGGVTVGADGFGFAPNDKGEYDKVPQIGNVIIEDNVDVGAGTTIDRATLGSTIIRKGVKLDNQIQMLGLSMLVQLNQKKACRESEESYMDQECQYLNFSIYF